MPNPLSPSLVHALANLVYKTDSTFQESKRLTPHASFAQVKTEATKQFNKHLKEAQYTEIQSNTTFFLTSTSGIFNMELLSGFGFLAEGGASRPGELVLATRGTNFEENKFDVATDVNVALATGPKGLPVHRGFYKTFQGYQHDLINFVTQHGRRRHIPVIHCVGHSLGGALANLNAVALRDAGFNVNLYTVGAPRVGHVQFAQYLTQHIPGSQIYRISNVADPVPMMPVWPFFHASSNQSEFEIKTTEHIHMDCHLLSSGYAGLSRMHSWSALAKPSPAYKVTLASFLAPMALMNHSLLYNQALLEYIRFELLNMLKVYGLITSTVLQTGLSCTITVVDLLVAALTKATQGTAQLAEKAKRVVHGMLYFLGRVVDTAKAITLDLIAFVVQCFIKEMSNRAQAAILRVVKQTQ